MSGVTVIADLAVAVVVGVIVSALVFAWQHAKHVKISRKENSSETRYEIEGPLFFASSTEFSQSFTPKDDRDEVYIDFANSRVVDHSGLEAIDCLAERYTQAGKTLHLLHLSEDCRKLLKRADKMIEVNVLEDPKYFVADDELA